MGKRMLSVAEVEEIRVQMEALTTKFTDTLADEWAAAVAALPMPRDPAEIERVMDAVTARLYPKFRADLFALIPPELH